LGSARGLRLRLPYESAELLHAPHPTTSDAKSRPHRHVNICTTKRSYIFKIASPFFAPGPSSTSNTSRAARTGRTTKLGRGGSAFAPSGSHTLAEFEQFELVDYSGIHKGKEGQAQHSEGEIKHGEKLRRLDQEDEMKFSHSIQFNAVPDWSSHYIAYSNLKKL
jgi:hypothetical protein